jgi:hypothetical protein
MSWQHVAWVESDSEPGKRHEIKRRADGQLGCGCTAYRFSKGTKTCKHLRALGSITSDEARSRQKFERVQVRRLGAETFTVRRAITFGAIPGGV